MPSRRALLRTLALGTAAAAGCTGLTGPLDGSSEEPTRSVGEQYETDDGRAVRVSHPVVHPSVTTVEAVSHHRYERVTDAGDAQFLSFLVTATGFEPGPGGRTNSHEPIDLPLAVETDDTRYSRVVPVGFDKRADRDRVAIRVPVADVSAAHVVWARDDGPQPRWRLPDPVLGDLDARPRFEVEQFTVPERVAAGETFAATVDVRNVGGRAGRFLATLGAKRGSLDVPESSVSVDVGATGTLRASITASGDGDWPIRVVLDWGAGRRERTVTVGDDGG
jgi:hypothetical protein